MPNATILPQPLLEQPYIFCLMANELAQNVAENFLQHIDSDPTYHRALMKDQAKFCAIGHDPYDESHVKNTSTQQPEPSFLHQNSDLSY